MENRMKLSWRIQKNTNLIEGGKVCSRSEALKLANKAYGVLASLKGGKASFTYIKRDGSVRPANGTTNHASIPARVRGTAGGGTPKDKFPKQMLLQTYYDFDRGWWRSFYITDVI